MNVSIYMLILTIYYVKYKITSLCFATQLRTPFRPPSCALAPTLVEKVKYIVDINERHIFCNVHRNGDSQQLIIARTFVRHFGPLLRLFYRKATGLVMTRQWLMYAQLRKAALAVCFCLSQSLSYISRIATPCPCRLV